MRVNKILFIDNLFLILILLQSSYQYSLFPIEDKLNLIKKKFIEENNLINNNFVDLFFGIKKIKVQIESNNCNKLNFIDKINNTKIIIDSFEYCSNQFFDEKNIIDSYSIYHENENIDFYLLEKERKENYKYYNLLFNCIGDLKYPVIGIQNELGISISYNFTYYNINVFYHLICHEFGHYIGLPHSSDNSSIMYYKDIDNKILINKIDKMKIKILEEYLLKNITNLYNYFLNKLIRLNYLL